MLASEEGERVPERRPRDSAYLLIMAVLSGREVEEVVRRGMEASPS
jgi:hypothetical protein